MATKRERWLAAAGEARARARLYDTLHPRFHEMAKELRALARQCVQRAAR